MRILDYMRLGLKNLWRHKGRSSLTILAVVIGAISMIIMLSLVIGAQRVATQQIESMGGLTLISVSSNVDSDSGSLVNTYTGPDDSGVKLNDTTVSRLKQIPNVVDATPIVGVWLKSMNLAGQDKKFYANLVAYDPGSKVLTIPISAGRALASDDMDKIVVGQEMLRSFGYKDDAGGIIGQKVILYSENGYTDWDLDPPKPPDNADKTYWESMQKHEITAEIIGVAAQGSDDGQNYITLAWGRRLMTNKRWEMNDSQKQLMQEQQKQLDEERQRQKDEMMKSGQKADFQDNGPIQFSQSDMLMLVRDDQLARNGYASILVKADSTDNVEKIAESIHKLGYGAQTAKQMLDEIKKIFRMIGLLIGTIGGIALFVASIGIINTMIMATYERTREIGILRACGATKANIRHIFIFEAAMLGFWGGVIGLAISFGLAKIGNIVGNQMAVSQGIPINNLISFPLWLILGVIALTTLIGTLAGLFPAIHASNMDPVEALRYE